MSLSISTAQGMATVVVPPGVAAGQTFQINIGPSLTPLETRIVTYSAGITVRQSAYPDSPVVETLQFGTIFYTQGAHQVVKGFHRYQLRDKDGARLTGGSEFAKTYLYVSVKKVESNLFGQSTARNLGIGIVQEEHYSKLLPQPEDLIKFTVPAGYSAGCDLWVRRPDLAMRCIMLTDNIIENQSFPHGCMGDWYGSELNFYSQKVRDTKAASESVPVVGTLVDEVAVVAAKEVAKLMEEKMHTKLAKKTAVEAEKDRLSLFLVREKNETTKADEAKKAETETKTETKSLEEDTDVDADDFDVADLTDNNDDEHTHKHKKKHKKHKHQKHKRKKTSKTKVMPNNEEEMNESEQALRSWD